MAFEPTALDSKKVEKVATPEVEVGEAKVDTEKLPEGGKETAEKEIATRVEAAPSGGAPVAAPAVVVAEEKDPELKKIEDILAEDMTDIFLSLPEEKRQAFKIKGEEVAQGIKAIINSGKIKLMKILELIRSWLKMVPGINKFFLEQEAKIKVDKLMGEFEKKASTPKDIL